MDVARVLGGPGTGKTTLLIEAAAARIAAGADPESVLLLTPGRPPASVRAAITARLLAARSAQPCAAVVREPLVRSVHSYAFAVLRTAAARAGDPPPRLVTGAEQDGIIRELLAGDLADGAARWPLELRPALGTEGFATELRDLLARCAERGVDPAALERIGRAHGRPEWAAAGRFARQYEQVMLLRAAVGTAAPQACVPALGAAELVGAALEALAADAELLAAERARFTLLLVDDAQHLDPQAARLVRVLAAGAGQTLLAGDPHQAVFGFRGAEPALLLGGDRPPVELSTSHRCAPAIARAISGMAAGLPAGGWRALHGTGGADTEDTGVVAVRVADSAPAEAALIADTLRRAHLVDGVPWAQLAVIVRSVPAAAGLTRALALAGVPVDPAPAGAPIAEQPGVRALLTVLDVVARHGGEPDDDQALALLAGPIGRMDPVALRQLRRALGRRGRSVAGALTGSAPALPAGLATPVARVRAVLASAARAHRGNHDPRYTLWQAWERGGLQRLPDRELAGITALFDIAEDYVARTAGASVSGLLDHVAALRLPPARHDPAGAAGDAATVAVLTPHAALGRDWDTVVIAGLQEGLWPNTTPRGGVLGTGRLLDVLDGLGELGEKVSARAPLLAEERRLLIAAMGRARRRLLITAVDSDAGDAVSMPSSFLTEVARYTCESPRTVAEEALRARPAPPVLSTAAVVGRLRAAVCAPDDRVGDAQRARAAAQLARLAAAGVPGADPAQWHGLAEPSTEEPLFRGEHTVTLSPSTCQTLTDCPLRWLAERHGGAGARTLSSTLGSLVHALVSDPAKTDEQRHAELESHWAALPFDSPWYAANELERHRAMLTAFAAWHSATRRELTEVATEVDLDGVVAEGVRIRGRADRLERDAQGRLVVVDLKTARHPVTKDDAQRHAQLGLYQLAVAAGVLEEGDRPGGGRLVYLGKPSAAGATEREQTALGPEEAAGWREAVRAAAAATAGPFFAARVNDGCTHCPIRPSCPAHASEPPGEPSGPPS